MQSRGSQYLHGFTKGFYSNRGTFDGYKSPLSSGYNRTFNRLSPAERRFEEDLQKVKRTVNEHEKREMLRPTLVRGIGSSPLQVDEDGLSEDAKKILRKYYMRETPLDNQRTDKELKRRLEDIEVKSTSISKLLKALLKDCEQGQVIQQFQTITEETKGAYEGHIAQLQAKLNRMESSLENKEKKSREDEEYMQSNIRDLKRKLKAKDTEMTELKEQNEKLMDELNLNKKEMKRTAEENMKLNLELKRMEESNTGSTDIKEREINRLNYTIEDLNKVLKDSKKDNTKNEMLIRDMTREITELKNRLMNKEEEVKDITEYVNNTKRYSENQQNIAQEMTLKYEKLREKKVIAYIKL